VEPDSNSHSPVVDYVVRWLTVDQIEVILERIDKIFPPRQPFWAVPREAVEADLLAALVGYVAASLNGHTPVTGKQLQSALKGGDLFQVYTPWVPAVRNVLGVLQYAGILSQRDSGEYVSGMQRFGHMRAEHMSRVRRDDRGSWYELPPPTPPPLRHRPVKAVPLLA
jgi:hypothetical protein